jgi:hypothetical protein
MERYGPRLISPSIGLVILSSTNSRFYGSSLYFLVPGKSKKINLSDKLIFIIMFAGVIVTTAVSFFLFLDSCKSIQITQKYLHYEQEINLA